MAIRKRIAIFVSAAVLLVATVVGLFMINMTRPNAETKVTGAREVFFNNWDAGASYKGFFNDSGPVWKVLGKTYAANSADGTHWYMGGLSPIVPGYARTYYQETGQPDYLNFGYDSRSFGLAQFYVTDATGEHRVYCFDYTTSFDSTGANLSSYATLLEAGIPTSVISEQLIMDTAKAVAALQADNWALLKAHAEEIAKDATWADPNYEGRSGTCPTFINGDAVTDSNTITKAEVVAMLKADSEQGNNAREYLTQWMIWDILNNWYAEKNPNPNFPQSLMGSGTGKGPSGEPVEQQNVACGRITYDNIINFKQMWDIGVAGYSSVSGSWEKSYVLEPGKSQTIRGDEATNFIATYDAAGNQEALWAGSSSALKITIDRGANTVTLEGLYPTGKYTCTSAWYTDSSGMIYSTSGGQYLGNESNIGTVGSRGGAQFVVCADALMQRRVSVTIEPTDAYITVHKSAPAGRNPYGAVYTVWANEACTSSLGTLTVQNNGEPAPLKIDMSGYATRDVWVTETGLPTRDTSTDWHWVADPQKYKVTLTPANTADAPLRVDSTDKVLSNYGYVQVYKTVLLSEPNSGRVYSPAGAVYGVYSDKDCHNELGRVIIGEDNYSDKLKVVWRPDEDGKDVWIKEIFLPAAFDDSHEWVMDETVYSTRVHGSTASIEPEDQPVEVIRSTDPIIEYGWFRVRKGTNTAYTDIVKDNSLYSVQHTRFVVYALTGKLATDPSGKTKVGEYETDADGWIDAQRVPVGTYRVEEIVAPPGHKLDIINEYDLTVTVDSTEETPVVQVFRNRPAADPFAIDFDKEWGKQNP